MRTLCFGEALVDLICQRSVSSLAEADAFVPYVGGASCNVAIAAARAGVAVELVGAAGDDPWGAWLHDRLEAERVGLQWFRLVGGQRTGLEFVMSDAAGEPTCLLRDAGIPGPSSALRKRVLDAVADTDALCFGSDVLVGKAVAELAMAARERALKLDRPIVFDAGIRLDRWDGNRGRAGAAAGACVPGAFLVKCSALEARLITGESHAERAAASLLAAGAQHVIVTLGAQGAILRGTGLRREVAGRPMEVRGTTGAGDVFTGVVLAALGQTDFYAPAIAAALPDAAEEAARACERWGALG